jgi:hypothetical protein
VIRGSTLEKFGPVRSVRPTLMFELGFEGINRSGRHKSGIAVRFPRMLRIRDDKAAARGRHDGVARGAARAAAGRRSGRDLRRGGLRLRFRKR